MKFSFRECRFEASPFDLPMEVIMSTFASSPVHEIEAFRLCARTTKQALQLNLKDITHEQSLIQPQPDGSCLNWVVGHLLCVYNDMLPLLKQRHVMEKETLKRYARGAPPLRTSSEALDFHELLSALDRAIERVDDGLGGLTSKELDAPAPVSPANNPDETVRSLLTIVSFHQAYHAGQTGLLRRIIGKAGAIA